MPLNLELDELFLRDMAERFPEAGFSCLSGRQVRSSPLTPAAWLAQLPEPSLPSVVAALQAQMGARWQGLQAETPVRRVALTALAAYAAGADVSRLLADLNMWATVASSGGSACSPEALVPDDIRAAASPCLEMAAASHDWSATVALAVVRRAKRSNGVLQNSHYLWLAAHDRLLWLLLDGYGRREPVAEILGVVAHEAAERVMAQPLPLMLLNDPAQALLAYAEA